jgi:hypothetical protein
MFCMFRQTLSRYIKNYGFKNRKMLNSAPGVLVKHVKKEILFVTYAFNTLKM